MFDFLLASLKEITTLCRSAFQDSPEIVSEVVVFVFIVVVTVVVVVILHRLHHTHNLQPRWRQRWGVRWWCVRWRKWWDETLQGRSREWQMAIVTVELTNGPCVDRAVIARLSFSKF